MGSFGETADSGRSPRGRKLPRRAGAAVLALGAALAGAGIVTAVSGGSVISSGTSAATLSLSQVEAKVSPALVDIVTTLDYGAGAAAGTGIVLTSSGEVLTNHHVVEGATSIKVTDVGNGRTYSASVVGYSASADIAVLQLKGASGLRTAELGDSSTVAVGASVVALGNAGGVGGTPSTATGVVTALDQSISAADQATGTAEQLDGMIATDANIQAGDSGGPLVNMKGQVIGIDTAGSSNFVIGPDNFGGGGGTGASRTTGFAIPVNSAMVVARQIEAGKASATVHIGASAFLGVQVSNRNNLYGQGQAVTGAVIAGTVPGSPAAASGLATYDTITTIGGHKVTSLPSLQSVMDLYRPGQSVKVTWIGPYGNSHTATVKLATGPVG